LKESTMNRLCLLASIAVAAAFAADCSLAVPDLRNEVFAA
jgi:hypothetical protein